MPSVVIYQSDIRRSRVICDAMAAGLRRHGIVARRRGEHEYAGVEADVAVFYGLAGRLASALQAYPAAGATAVYVDLGYWLRREGGRYTGWHKVAVNARHPTAYFQRRRHDDSRLRRCGVTPQAWRDNGSAAPVLLAGMGAKAAESLGMQPEEWERRAIADIRRHSSRPIIYRPKPSWRDARPIEGTVFDREDRPIERHFPRIHAVVTHHSNAAVEALAGGLPAFCWEGVASTMSLQDLSRIESPHRPDGRAQWLNDIAWCQWSPAEMEAGACWQYLRDERLVPR